MVEALVKPELLVWGRDSAGFSVDMAAKKINVKPEKLASWESGEARPTFAQLIKLAQVYKRPVAVFYLPTPPKNVAVLHDFRNSLAKAAKLTLQSLPTRSGVQRSEEISQLSF